MFEMAWDYVRHYTDFELVGGYFSPVSDAYGKVGLAQGCHRVAMCEAAVAQSPWLMVDAYETLKRDATGTKPEYVPTADVLRHIDHEVNTVLGGVMGTDGRRKRARICLLAGADLIMSMSASSVLVHIMKPYKVTDGSCTQVSRTYGRRLTSTSYWASTEPLSSSVPAPTWMML